MKIHIIGGAGSGKTYLAALLSKQFAVPHYDLDDIYWDNGAGVYGVKTSETQRDSRLNEMISQNGWIVEGVYCKTWVNPSLAAADKIVVLIPPVAEQEERILKRYEARLTGAETSTKRETPETIRKLLEWNTDYNTHKLPRFIEQCEYKEKIITASYNLDVLELLSN